MEPGAAGAGGVVALLRRHLAAVTVAAALAAGAGYALKHTPPTYQESATLILTPPKAAANKYDDSLVTTSEIMVRWTLGAQGQQELRQAGVGSGFNVALVNLYNQEYPNYPFPFVTVSAAAADPAVAHRMFVTGSQVFVSELLARQVKQGVLPRNRITAYSVGDTGPVISQGSRFRSFAGLLVLTIVVALLVSAFLDHHPIRPRGLLRARRRTARDPVAQDWPAARARPGAG
jgi:hypothetical protein